MSPALRGSGTSLEDQCGIRRGFNSCTIESTRPPNRTTHPDTESDKRRAAGLAALLAGVPRIVLSGRSTPPPDRRERYLVEYDVIYKSLLRAPGVKLSVNSHYAAGRYARWLGIDERAIAVAPNGVAPLSTEADLASQAAFGMFESRTGKGALTIGAVMRVEEVKRLEKQWEKTRV